MGKLVGGDSVGFGASRAGGGIQGRAGSNVQVVYKNGNANPLDAPRSLRDPALNNNKYKYSGNTQGSVKPQPITGTGNVKKVTRKEAVFNMNSPFKRGMPTQQQLGTAKGNARGLKAANKPTPKKQYVVEIQGKLYKTGGPAEKKIEELRKMQGG